MKRMAVVITVVIIALLAWYFFFNRGIRSGEVLVLCGGSMRAPMEQLVKEYLKDSGEQVVMSYGDSGELVAQLKQARRGDILVCHDPFMAYAADQKLVADWTTLANLDIVIVVPKGNPQKIAGFEDLARPGLRLGVGDMIYSTSGWLVKMLLDKSPEGASIRKNIKSESKGHQARCTEVALGSLDAGIAWNAVAYQFRDKLDMLAIPKDNLDAVTSATYKQCDLRKVKVTLGVTEGARGKAGVRRFYEYAVKRGPEIFNASGFTPAGK